MQNGVSEELKKGVYEDLAEIMISALENGEFLVEDSENSAELIHSQLDTITQMGDLVNFLQVLSSKWNIYQPIYLKYKSEELKNKVQTELSQMTN